MVLGVYSSAGRDHKGERARLPRATSSLDPSASLRPSHRRTIGRRPHHVLDRAAGLLVDCPREGREPASHTLPSPAGSDVSAAIEPLLLQAPRPRQSPRMGRSPERMGSRASPPGQIRGQGPSSSRMKPGAAGLSGWDEAFGAESSLTPLRGLRRGLARLKQATPLCRYRVRHGELVSSP